jgi:hypothetical protein
MRNAYRIFVGKTKGKRTCERPRCRWEDIIRMNHREVWWKMWTGFICLMLGNTEMVL